MSPNIPKEDVSGKESAGGDEEDTQDSETVSLLTLPSTGQILPPTPTLGTSLTTPWRNHQGSAPSSPHLRRGGAWALPKESSFRPKSPSCPSRRPVSTPQAKARSPCPSGRKAIRSAWLNEIESCRYRPSYAPVQPIATRKGLKPDLRAVINLPAEPAAKTIERWIGVNGEHEHIHAAASTIEVTSPHIRRELQTPHIIVSPEMGEHEPFFLYPDHLDNKDNKKDEKEEQPPLSTSAPQKVSSADKEQPPPTSDNQLSDAATVVNSLPTVGGGTEEQRKVEQTKCPPTPPPPPPPPSPPEVPNVNKEYARSSSADSSSSENYTTYDQEQPYFGGNDSPVEENVPQPQYPVVTPRNRQRCDNNNFRSMSMVSLDPSDPFMRKTRRNSMIDMMRRVSSTSNVGAVPSTPIPMGRSNSKTSLIVPTNVDWKVQMNESLILCVSALYAKLLVVMGMAFPIAEIISDNVPLIFYNSFYLYLYFGSIMFLIYAYLFLLRTKSLTTEAFKSQMHSIRNKIPRIEVNWQEIPMPHKIRNFVSKKKEPDTKSEKADRISVSTSAYKSPKYTITESSNHGSMYLKMGAVIFGIGSMIYSGLEFGQYFELRAGAKCANILMAISPVARMIFTFLQMYFIFLNSRVAINKHTIIARFGLMHMIGTNLCIWLNVLVQETKHEIAHLTATSDDTSAHLYPGQKEEDDPHKAVLGENLHHINHSTFHSLHHAINESLLNHSHGDMLHVGSHAKHNVVRRNVNQDDLLGCRRINLMGHVVSSASPFLFPCTIEYSLLCAGVLYVMWKNININKPERTVVDGDSDISTFIARKVRHHYSVDCARASRGLFMGIFILVLTIISLILFYVLISNEQFKRFAILEANIIELSIYSLAIISVIVGMKQMRELEFILEGDIELDNILLIIAQAGVYIYTSFTIIGGYFSLQASHTLALLTAVMTLIQTTLQTLFILDGSRRCCYTADQLDRKPGREMVTFLLVCNLAMWAISTFETSRADVHPTQLRFYGIWAWTIISHVSMPLAIFYRFHVTVCLGEIWKRSYKLKNEFMGL